MNEIKERAMKRATELSESVPDENVRGLIRHAYLIGREEQRKEDIDAIIANICGSCKYEGLTCESKSDCKFLSSIIKND